MLQCIRCLSGHQSNRNLKQQCKNHGFPDKSDEIEITEEAIRLTESEILNIGLKGIDCIEKVYSSQITIKEFDSNGDLSDKRKEWILETDGINLIDVLQISEVDTNRTISNDINEIYKVFGIEATRTVIFNELRNVISFDGTYVNYRHFTLLADTMTYRGDLMAITQNGMSKIETGPLLRCSFEQPTKILFNAAIFSERDNLCGPSENIIMGNLGPYGTGCVDILVE
ncbi:MAG: hypothetical protein IH795_04270, partial [Bacteroidetes bacterium]|nr:hypothetical protein [Bacteroidota bacterium]